VQAFVKAHWRKALYLAAVAGGAIAQQYGVPSTVVQAVLTAIGGQ
jgi:hypothetical protein